MSGHLINLPAPDSDPVESLLELESGLASISALITEKIEDFRLRLLRAAVALATEGFNNLYPHTNKSVTRGGAECLIMHLIGIGIRKPNPDAVGVVFKNLTRDLSLDTRGVPSLIDSKTGIAFMGNRLITDSPCHKLHGVSITGVIPIDRLTSSKEPRIPRSVGYHSGVPGVHIWGNFYVSRILGLLRKDGQPCIQIR